MRSIALCACLCLLVAAAAAAPPVPPPPAAVPTFTPEQVSQAELLLRIRQAITEDLQRANVLRMRSRYLDQEYEAASAAFDSLDAALRPATARPRPAVAGASDEVRSAAAPPALDTRWRRARDLLDILLQRRQSLDQQLAVLEDKHRTHEAAARFVASGGIDAPAGAQAADEQAQDGAPPGQGDAASDAASGTPPAPATQDAAPPDAPGASIGALPALAQELGTPRPGAESAAAEPSVYDSRVARAERELARQEAALRAAEHNVRITEELISLNQDELSLIRSGTLLARRHAELLDAEARERTAGESADAPGDDAESPVARQARELRQHADRAATALTRDEQRLAALAARLQSLKELRTVVQDALIEREAGHEAARRRLAFVQSPLAPHRLLTWFVQAVPRILVLLAVFALVWVVGRWLARRVVDAAVNRIRRSANEERVQRVQTLRRALRSALTLLLTLVAALIVLPEFGVDATVLLGSAAVLSLALAFGAQSLIKDYFSGFMILSENQYRIGNVVRINEIAGVVEDISLRMTMLRDAEGIAHFVPHSEIRTVSNLTHGWAQAVVDVRVGYREDIDEVMRVLDGLAAGMQQDPEYGALILAAPELWGVEALSESAVVVRLVMRTRPLKQWQVKREMLRRIKNRFDELGIQMPVPQLQVHMQEARRAG